MEMLSIFLMRWKWKKESEMSFIASKSLEAKGKERAVVEELLTRYLVLLSMEQTKVTISVLFLFSLFSSLGN